MALFLKDKAGLGGRGFEKGLAALGYREVSQLFAATVTDLPDKVFFFIVIPFLLLKHTWFAQGYRCIWSLIWLLYVALTFLYSTRRWRILLWACRKWTFGDFGEQ